MMEYLKRLSASIGFTPAEQRVAVFLAAAFLLGIGVRWYRVATDTGPGFDYSAEDAAFARASALPAESLAVRDAALPGPADSARHRAHPVAARKKEVAPGSVNINTARKEELMRLPGIGEAMAERILQYRREHGSFTTLEELMNIKGIGKKKFARIAPGCTVGR